MLVETDHGASTRQKNTPDPCAKKKSEKAQNKHRRGVRGGQSQMGLGKTATNLATALERERALEKGPAKPSRLGQVEGEAEGEAMAEADTTSVRSRKTWNRGRLYHPPPVGRLSPRRKPLLTPTRPRTMAGKS